MQLNLKHCTELELISYQILLLHQINDFQDTLRTVEKELTKIKTKRKKKMHKPRTNTNILRN